MKKEKGWKVKGQRLYAMHPFFQQKLPSKLISAEHFNS